MDIEEISTVPIPGQACGTSGLRKKSKVFEQPHYVENFVQSVLDALPDGALNGATMVCGGDGRYLTRPTVAKVASICAAAGVSRFIVGMGGLLSTPAVSGLIRERGAVGGFILTASHNPGGPDGDFGIKFNTDNGGPAPSSLTDAVLEKTRSIRSYRMARLSVDLVAELGEHPYGDDGASDASGAGASREFDAAPGFAVEVIDPVEAYLERARQAFDMDELRVLLTRSDFRFAFDAMHGVTGPYARRIFVEELGAPAASVRNAVPREDFGGGHPDPNLAHAKGIVGLATRGEADLAAACDGDGDRCMVVGLGGTFVNPSDSVAVIAARAPTDIKFFRENGLAGVARSMPTSQALDAVAQKMNVPCYEVPTGWKFFSSLLDAGMIALCGEESFGAGSSAVREKDGIFTALCWLSILAKANAPIAPGSRALVSVADILQQHWGTYGRHYFARYDYEGVDATEAEAVVSRAAEIVAECASEGQGLLGHRFQPEGHDDHFVLDAADDFAYHDPVTGASAKGQGLRFLFNDNSRIVLRKSGTGSTGVTLRFYFERFSNFPDEKAGTPETALAPIIAIAEELTGVSKILGEPTVRT